MFGLELHVRGHQLSIHTPDMNPLHVCPTAAACSRPHASTARRVFTPSLRFPCNRRVAPKSRPSRQTAGCGLKNSLFLLSTHRLLETLPPVSPADPRGLKAQQEQREPCYRAEASNTRGRSNTRGATFPREMGWVGGRGRRARRSW